MTKPAVEFEITANELRLVYRPRDDTSWVRDRFERGDGLVVKGTFHLTPQDLVEEAAEAAASGDDDGDIPGVEDDRSASSPRRTNCAAMSRRGSAPWFASTPSQRSTLKRC
jgi:hypothetical protein